MVDISTFPHQPGCYIHYAKDGSVLYIGKAKDLHARVSSYFTRPPTDPKTAALVAQISHTSFIVTPTELDALLLEQRLIQTYKPKYNVLLRDGWRYASLAITHEPFPRLIVVRDRAEYPNAEFYGPFPSSSERNKLLHFLIRLFKLRTCRKFPPRACIRASLGLCSAPCTGGITAEEYAARIDHVRRILRGETNVLITELTEKMHHHAQLQEFEEALYYRDVIASLRTLSTPQSVEHQKPSDADVIVSRTVGNKLYIVVFHVRHGALFDPHQFVFDAMEDALDQFFIQFYSMMPIPPHLILSHHIDPTIHAFLEQRAGHRVRIHVPRRGASHRLLLLAEQNIDALFFRETQKVHALQEALLLEHPPEVIECFDISHLGGTQIVGSLVQFHHGRPRKDAYRRFLIRSCATADDPRAIEEVVFRRYRRLVTEGQPLPDLIIVDGGKAQWNAAHRALTRLHLTLPLIAIAKRYEEIYLSSEKPPLRLSHKHLGLTYVREIRDEAHRFALSYQRLRRTRAYGV